MKEILSNIFLFIFISILSFMESIYNLLHNERFLIAASIILTLSILWKILDKLTNLNKLMINITEQLIKHFYKRDEHDLFNDNPTMMSILNDIRDNLQTDTGELINKIKRLDVSKDNLITEEDIKKYKKEIFDLLELSVNFNDIVGLPVEKSAAIRAFRFLLLMYEYNYLTKNNHPEIDCNLNGGICLSFGFTGISWFTIEFPPEKNQSINYYNDWINDNIDPVVSNRTDEGYSNNPLRVLYKLIESGDLIDA